MDPISSSIGTEEEGPKDGEILVDKKPPEVGLQSDGKGGTSRKAYKTQPFLFLGAIIHFEAIGKG